MALGVAKGLFIDTPRASVSGLAHMIHHPILTVEGLYGLIRHPLRVASAFSDWNYRYARASQYQQGKMFGQFAGAVIGTFFGGAGVISRFGKINKFIKKVTKGTGDVFKTGKDFESSITTSSGVKVGGLAEVEVSGDTLTLKDVTIYPEGVEGSAAKNAVGARDILQWRNSVVQMAKQQGFKKLVIQGMRVGGSSSAIPGHSIDITIDLTKR